MFSKKISNFYVIQENYNAHHITKNTSPIVDIVLLLLLFIMILGFQY